MTWQANREACAEAGLAMVELRTADERADYKATFGLGPTRPGLDAMETWLGGYCESEDSSTCRSAASDAAAWTWVSDGATLACTGHEFGSANAQVTAAQDPAADAVDSFFDDSCGSGYCIASINGGEFPDCVQGKCCPSAAQETLCNGKCMDFGETCCKDTAVCGFGERCLDDGTCIENDCEAILKYDYGLNGDVVTPEVPSCMTRPECISEIKEQGGKQCMRTYGGGNIDTQTCVTGGWENQCLGDWGADCGFAGPGECEFDNLSDEGKEKSGVLRGGALIAVIVTPIGVVLLLGILGLVIGIWCCCKPGGCCNPKKKEPAVVAGVKTTGVEVLATSERLILLDTQPLLSPSAEGIAMPFCVPFHGVPPPPAVVPTTAQMPTPFPVPGASSIAAEAD